LNSPNETILLAEAIYLFMSKVTMEY